MSKIKNIFNVQLINNINFKKNSIIFLALSNKLTLCF